MLFLVRFDYCQPDNVSDEQWRDILRRESEHGTEGVRQGKLKEIYLVAGMNTAFCVFDVASAEELDQFVTSLPLFRYCEISMYPLIDLGDIKRKSLKEAGQIL